MLGDMNREALVKVLTTVQQSSSHYAQIQDVGEGLLDDLGLLAYDPFTDARSQMAAIVVDSPERLLIPVPMRESRTPLLGEPGCQVATIQVL